MITAIEIADPVFLTIAGVLSTLLVAAVSYTATALMRATATLDRLDRDHAHQRKELLDLRTRFFAHLDESKDQQIEDLKIKLAEAKGL